MNFDEKLKRELENEANDIDQILVNNEGLFDLLLGSFKGGMRRWIILFNVVAIVATILLFWTGYRFYHAMDVQQQIFWGVCFLVSFNVASFIKNWFFMEMNRSSLMREIKRVELAVAKLTPQ